MGVILYFYFIDLSLLFYYRFPTQRNLIFNPNIPNKAQKRFREKETLLFGQVSRHEYSPMENVQ